MAQKAAGAPPADVVGRRVVVHGRVQGVAFRAAVSSRARESGVAGWVRNNPDGTIEALFEGPPEGVDKLVRFVHAGSPGARVESVDVSEEEPTGLQSFEVAAARESLAQAEAQLLPRIFIAAQGRDDRDPFGSASWRVRSQVQAGDVVLFFTRVPELAYAARAASEARAVEGRGFVADLDNSSWFRLANPISIGDIQASSELATWLAPPRSPSWCSSPLRSRTRHSRVRCSPPSRAARPSRWGLPPGTGS